MIVFFNEAIWNIFVARLFSLETTRAGYMRLKAPIDRVLGGLLAALGLKIATT
jgi:threonine/homoserine/homoserine lactone efflux protein